MSRDKLLYETHTDVLYLKNLIYKHIQDLIELYDLEKTIRFYLDYQLISSGNLEEEPKICFHIRFKGDNFLIISFNNNIKNFSDRENYMLESLSDTYKTALSLINYEDEERIKTILTEVVEYAIKHKISYKQKMIKAKNLDYYLRERDNIKQHIKQSLRTFNIFTENINIILEYNVIKVQISNILYFNFNYILGILFFINRDSFGVDSKNYLLVVDKIIPIEEELVYTIAADLELEIY